MESGYSWTPMWYEAPDTSFWLLVVSCIIGLLIAFLITSISDYMDVYIAGSIFVIVLAILAIGGKITLLKLEQDQTYNRITELERIYDISDIIEGNDSTPNLNNCGNRVNDVTFKDHDGNLIEGKLSIDGCTARLFVNEKGTGKSIPYVPDDSKNATDNTTSK